LSIYIIYDKACRIIFRSIAILYEHYSAIIIVNVFSIKKVTYYMSYKKEINSPLDTEQAKDMELDETPTPTRKMSKSSVPVSNKAEPSTHDRVKGRRVIK
jgi:hypothetical protein